MSNVEGSGQKGKYLSSLNLAWKRGGRREKVDKWRDALRPRARSTLNESFHSEVGKKGWAHCPVFMALINDIGRPRKKIVAVGEDTGKAC